MVVKITSLEGNGRQNYKFNSCVVVHGTGTVQIESHVGGNQGGGGEKQLIDLEWSTHGLKYKSIRGLLT